ncbi:Serine-rich protein-related [Quillaja saponaria]|uniref:Serine-rich protein-related n=1 Tax=Quillaja saponaria TaxID=32244 RepID=A0AAD7L5H2_QUISA|nr:Serine-rich protein-related [Quillaja saponaria]
MATMNSSSARTCLCSPTTHPGSFRCSLHRGYRKLSPKSTVPVSQSKNIKDSKIDVIKAFLLQIIKPSSHDLQRRRNFQPRPTRFCLMKNTNGDGLAVS